MKPSSSASPLVPLGGVPWLPVGSGVAVLLCGAPARSVPGGDSTERPAALAFLGARPAGRAPGCRSAAAHEKTHQWSVRMGSSEPGTAASAFVSARDGSFWRHGRPYRYVGANMWYAMLLDPGRLVRELDRLKALGVQNLRVLGSVEEVSDVSAQATPAVQSRPGEYDEEVLKGLDRLLYEAGSRGMTVVVLLNNMWQWSGGFAAYVSWATGETAPPMKVGASDEEWQAHQAFAIRFYALPAARALYYRYVRAIAARVNSFSGVRYTDDPTIFAWELANEPRPLEQVEAYRAWIDEAAAVVRASAPQHMVALGSEGPTPWPGYVRTSLLDDHKAVDYVAIHVWPQNWLWYDPTAAADPATLPDAGGGLLGVAGGLAGGWAGGWAKGLAGGSGDHAVPSGGAARPAASPPRTLDSAIRRSASYVDDAARAAVALGKPLVVEEFGLARERASMDASSSTASRDIFYRWMCSHVAETAPAAGLNFWAWAGEGRTGQLLGDPPHEPQGWYSVFDTDTDTHAAIYECSQHLAGAPKARREAAAPDAIADTGVFKPPFPALMSDDDLARDRQQKQQPHRRHRELPPRRGERSGVPGAVGYALADGAPGQPPSARLTVMLSDMDERVRAPRHQPVGKNTPDAVVGGGSRAAALGWLSRPPHGSRALALPLVQSALICCCLCCCWAVLHRVLRCARRRRELLPTRHELLRRSSESDFELEAADGHDRHAAGGVSFRRGLVRTPSPSWGPMFVRPGGARPAAAAAAEHESGYGGDCES